jgi:hypothetical protein
MLCLWVDPWLQAFAALRSRKRIRLQYGELSGFAAGLFFMAKMVLVGAKTYAVAPKESIAAAF